MDSTVSFGRLLTLQTCSLSQVTEYIVEQYFNMFVTGLELAEGTQ